MFRDDHARRADESVRPERRRTCEVDANGKQIDLFDLDVLVGANCRGGSCRVGGVFPVEHDIVCSEGPAIVPRDTFFELPGHRHAVERDPAILDIRNLGGEHGRQIAVGIPCRERLVENTRPLLVLGAASEMRIEQGQRLPKQRLERSAPAGFGRLVLGRRRRLRQAGVGEDLGRKGCSEAEADHPLHKVAARYAAYLHRCY
jgi:hypothetical protein